MTFHIHKMPTKVSATGLVGLAFYFFIVVMTLRDNRYYYLFLGGGLWGVAMLFIRSVGCFFISTYTVTESTIETVTPVGGLIKIDFANLDWERTTLSDAGLLLVPIKGESIFVSAAEFSKQDIARLAHHVGASNSGWFQAL